MGGLRRPHSSVYASQGRAAKGSPGKLGEEVTFTKIVAIWLRNSYSKISQSRG